MHPLLLCLVAVMLHPPQNDPDYQICKKSHYLIVYFSLAGLVLTRVVNNGAKMDPLFTVSANITPIFTKCRNELVFKVINSLTSGALTFILYIHDLPSDVCSPVKADDVIMHAQY